MGHWCKRTRLLLVSELELNFEFNWHLFDFYVSIIGVNGVIESGYFSLEPEFTSVSSTMCHWCNRTRLIFGQGSRFTSVPLTMGNWFKKTRLLLVSELDLDFEFNWHLFNFSVTIRSGGWCIMKRLFSVISIMG